MIKVIKHFLKIQAASFEEAAEDDWYGGIFVDT